MKRIGILSFCLSLFSFSLIAQDEQQTGFYETNTIQEIRITFEQEDWRYLLDSLRFNGDELLLGNVTLNEVDLQDVGVRYIGSRSFQPGSPRNGLYLKLNFIKQNQDYLGNRSMKLSSALRDPSMVREVLGYEIARQYMPAPRANYARVYINDDYYGLFVSVEVIEQKFLEDNFGSSDGTFVRCAPRLDVKTPEGCKKGVFGSLQYEENAKCYLHNFELLSETGWDDLIELTRVLEKEPDRIDEVLNVDRTLWMLAFNNALVNLSSYLGQYSNNFYLYKDENGQFNPIIYDLNLAFGSYKNTGVGSDLKMKQLEELDPLLHIDNPYKPLISQLLEDEHHRKLYLSHLRRIVYDYFKNDKVAEQARELQANIEEAFAEDKNSFYSVEEFEGSLENVTGKRSRIPGIITFTEARYQYLKKHPDLSVIPPEITDLEVARRQRLSSELVESFKISVKVDNYTKRVRLFYRYQDDEDFRDVTMYDDGVHHDGEADDGVYGVEILPGAGSRAIEFYIYAENAKLVSYDPQRYMYERHRISLEELNQ